MAEIVEIPDHLLPTRIVRAEVARTLRFLEVRLGTTREMVLEPDFWVHLCGGDELGRPSVIKVHDRIEVVAQDGSFDMDLRVVAIDPRGFWAQVRVLREWPEKALSARTAEKPAAPVKPPKMWPDADGYRVEWGFAHRWRIIDRAGQVVSKGHASQDAAIMALAEIKGEKRDADEEADGDRWGEPIASIVEQERERRHRATKAEMEARRAAAIPHRSRAELEARQRRAEAAARAPVVDE